MDCFVITKMRTLGLGFEETKERISDVFIDVSQSHGRSCHTANGLNKCLTTSTCLYNFGQDRHITPWECLRFQGYPLTLKIPSHISPQHLKDFSGEGMFLPSLSIVLWALYYMVDLTGKAVKDLHESGSP